MSEKTLQTSNKSNNLKWFAIVGVGAMTLYNAVKSKKKRRVTVLPGKGGIGEQHALGKDSTSFISPSFLTQNVDKASVRNNELKPGEKLD